MQSGCRSRYWRVPLERGLLQYLQGLGVDGGTESMAADPSGSLGMICNRPKLVNAVETGRTWQG